MQSRQLIAPRFLTPIVLALSCLLMWTPATLGAGADIYAVGAGSVAIGGELKPITFAVSAHTGPQGDFGTFKWTQASPPFAPFEARVDLDCVNVFSTGTGGGAWVQGQVTKVSPDPNVFGIEVGDENLFYLEDNGNPPGLVPDEINGAFYGVPPQLCKSLGPSGGFAITQGNINIKLGS